MECKGEQGSEPAKELKLIPSGKWFIAGVLLLLSEEDHLHRWASKTSLIHFSTSVNTCYSAAICQP